MDEEEQGRQISWKGGRETSETERHMSKTAEAETGKGGQSKRGGSKKIQPEA